MLSSACTTSAHNATRLISRVALLACAFFMLAMTAPDTPHPALDRPDFSQLQQGTVTRILDEDTLLLRIGDKTERYDLLGIGSFSERDKGKAAHATDALSRLALDETVWIQHDPRGERPPSNRLAAYLYRAPDGLPINLELIRQGYTRHTPSWMTIHTEVFDFYAKRARQLNRGIWDPDAAFIVPDPDTDQPLRAPDLSPEPEPRPTASKSDTVYITTYGKRYHREDCAHLSKSSRPTTRDKVSGTHQPCKSCRPDD